MTYFSQKLQQIMQIRGLSQKELADMAHVSQAAVSKWLNTDYLPKVKSVEPLAKSLGLTVGDLIGDFGNNIQLSEDDKCWLALSPQDKKMLLGFLKLINENR